MAFSPQFLDELRARISLAEVVGRQVRLVRRGREHVGLCPFHNEKTPSFNVVEDKGFYHCFGCGAHGDVIGFSMRAQNLSFREAVEALARQAGLEIPEETPRERERATQAATLHEACEAACGFFETQLRSARGARALDYLRRRGVAEALLRQFRLGYAPAGQSVLLQELSPRFPERLLIEAGLARRDEAGRVFDFFRDRVIFPIMDRQGRVVAFGGRILGDGQPKYLNSPDTPIFHKGRNLFALHLARPCVKPEAPPIVGEGYMDVIALHGAGFRTAVAPLGTALTEEQLTELWKLAPQPVLCFDGDAAGQRAAGRALERALPLMRPGSWLNFVSLPAGEDPDSLIQAYGAPEFQRCLNSSKNISEYLWEMATRGQDFTSPEKLSELEESLRKKIYTIENKQLQSHFSRFLNDKIWAMWVANRKKKDKVEFLEEIKQWFNNEAAKTKVQMLILAVAINHPDFARSDIDQFATVQPAKRDLRELHEKVMELIAGDPEVSAEHLQERLADAGLGLTVNKIFRSEIYRSVKFAHARAEPEAVATGWRAVFSRYLLPEVKRLLDEAQSRLAQETNEENWNTVMMYRQLFEEQNTEAPLIRERWDAVERVGEWRPGDAAAERAANA